MLPGFQFAPCIRFPHPETSSAVWCVVAAIRTAHSTTQVAATPRGALQSMTTDRWCSSSNSNPRVDSLKLSAPGLPEPRGNTGDKYLQQKQPIKNGRHLSMGILCNCDLRREAKRPGYGHLQHLGPWCRVLARSCSDTKQAGQNAVLGGR